MYLATNNEPAGRSYSHRGGERTDVIASFQRAAHWDGWLFNTFDLVFVPVPGNWITFVQPGFGLQGVYFYSLTLGAAPPVVVGLP